MTEEIKPCPFCGGRVMSTHGLINAPFLFFKCPSCGAVVSFDSNKCNKAAVRKNYEPTIEAWNRRASE